MQNGFHLKRDVPEQKLTESRLPDDETAPHSV
jgi:hypothetical protein